MNNEMRVGFMIIVGLMLFGYAIGLMTAPLLALANGH